MWRISESQLCWLSLNVPLHPPLPEVRANPQYNKTYSSVSTNISQRLPNMMINLDSGSFVTLCLIQVGCVFCWLSVSGWAMLKALQRSMRTSFQSDPRLGFVIKGFSIVNIQITIVLTGLLIICRLLQNPRSDVKLQSFGTATNGGQIWKTTSQK